MQGPVDTVHLIIDIATPLVLIAVSWVGMLINTKLGEIKLEQAQAKAELVKNQNEIAADLQRKHQENTQAIAVHNASDDAKFSAMGDKFTTFGETLRRVENKLDRMNGGAK